jgi:uncharacterized protein (DUF2141 family)
MVAVFKSAGQFMTDSVYKGAILAITAVEELVKFENVPYGDYAIAAIHDVDKDGELDKNFLGIPTEGYGFTNHATGKHGPPEWNQASFTMDERNQARIIQLAYGLPK